LTNKLAFIGTAARVIRSRWYSFDRHSRSLFHVSDTLFFSRFSIFSMFLVVCFGRYKHDNDTIYFAVVPDERTLKYPEPKSMLEPIPFELPPPAEGFDLRGPV
jgi:hypothetical protein